MTGDQFGNLAYIGLMLAVIGGYFFLNNRLSLNKTMQYAAIWGLIFVGAIAAFGLWDDIKRQSGPAQTSFASDGAIVVPQSRDGHFHLNIEINGTPVEFVVDTGASGIVITLDDAERVGLAPEDLAFLGRALTANGEVRTAPIRLDSMVLGDIVDTNVSAWVNEGDLDQSLLGMSYLRRFERLEISDGTLRLER